MKRIIAFTLCLILLSQQAEAVRGRRPSRSQDAQDGLKSKTTASTLSYGCTFVPIAIGAVIVGTSLGASAGQETTGWVLGVTAGGLGLIVGPVTGHIYAGKGLGTPGLKFRIAGFAAAGLGAVLLAAESDPGGIFEATPQEQAGGALVVVGGALQLAATIVDLSTVGRSVDQYNRTHAAPSLSIAPGYNPSSETFGLTATLRF